MTYESVDRLRRAHTSDPATRLEIDTRAALAAAGSAEERQAIWRAALELAGTDEAIDRIAGMNPDRSATASARFFYRDGQELPADHPLLVETRAAAERASTPEERREVFNTAVDLAFKATYDAEALGLDAGGGLRGGGDDVLVDAILHMAGEFDPVVGGYSADADADERRRVEYLNALTDAETRTGPVHPSDEDSFVARFERLREATEQATGVSAGVAS